MLKINITKEYLEQKYLKEYLSTTKIAELSGWGASYIRKNLIKLGIKIIKRPSINLIGSVFNKLTVIDFYGPDEHHNYCWLCKCECGNERIVRSANLTFNRTKNCGKCKWHGYGDIKYKQFYFIRAGAKARNIKFDITIEYIWDLYIKQNRKCALSGIEIIIDRNYNRKNSTASLDRIDSNRGYIEGNIQWVHKDINYMKLDQTDNEFINWCHMVSLYNSNNNFDYSI